MCSACSLLLLGEGQFRPCAAVRTELEVDAEAVDACLRCTVIVAVVEDVVNAEVRHRILTELLLQHEVPDAEGLRLIALRARPGVLIGEDIAARQVAVHCHVVRIACDRVAVEHVDVVVAPEGCTEAACYILVVEADVQLVLRLVEQLAGHIRIALVDGMEIGIAELARPMLVELLLYLELQPRDLCFADVLKAVEHIGRVAELLCRFEIRMEVDVVARVVGRHVVADRVAEEVHPHGGPLRLALDADVEVEGLLGLQVRVARPVPAETRTVLIDGAAAVHFPVVVELAHARLRIARTEVRLEAQVGIALDDVAREAEIRCHMCAEEAAVVETQDGRENRVIVHHPRIADHEMILVDRRLTDNDLILQGLLNLLKEFAVQRVVHDLVGIAVVGQPVEIAVPPDQVV